MAGAGTIRARSPWSRASRPAPSSRDSSSIRLIRLRKTSAASSLMTGSFSASAHRVSWCHCELADFPARWIVFGCRPRSPSARSATHAPPSEPGVWRGSRLKNLASTLTSQTVHMLLCCPTRGRSKFWNIGRRNLAVDSGKLAARLFPVQWSGAKRCRSSRIAGTRELPRRAAGAV